MASCLLPILECLDSRTLLSAGDLDPAFNSAALVYTELGAGSSVINDIKAFPDGGMIETGTVRVRHGGHLTGETQLALAKYNFDGSLDTLFGAGGKIAATPRGMTGGLKLALTPDGGFIVMGATSTGGGIMEASGGEMLLKFNADGKIDTSFGKNGLIKPERMTTFAVDPQGRVLVGGFHEPTDRAHVADAVLTRYTAAGKLDTGFNKTGQFISMAAPVAGDQQFRTQTFNSIAFDAQGRLLASVVTFANVPNAAAANQLTIYRFTDSGKVDRSYASNGKATIPLTIYAEEYTARQIGGVLADGSIILLSHDITRVDPNGQIDPNYGKNGAADIPIAPLPPSDSLYSREVYNQFAVGADGSVVFVPYTPGLEVTRINAQGHVDSSFGSGGSIALEPTADPTDGYLTSLDIAPDGSIVAAGQDGAESPSGRVDTRRGVVARVMASEGPAVQLVPRTMQSPSGYLSMTVLIRDPEGVDAGTLDDNDLKLFDSGGNTRKIRFLSEADVSGDGKYIRATYRIIGPNSSPWTNQSNGTYEVRVQRKQIADKDGNTATAQVLGTIRVKIV